MKSLTDLPNIGRKLAEELAQSGIHDVKLLCLLGSVQATIRLQEHGYSVCANTLYALEGAIQGVRWHHLNPKERSALWLSFLSLADRPSS